MNFTLLFENIRTVVRRALGDNNFPCFKATPVMDLDGNAILTMWLELDSCICHNLMHTISAIFSQ